MVVKNERLTMTKNKEIITFENFVKICNDLHDIKYDYSKSNYNPNNPNNIITVIDKDNGSFIVRQKSHMSSQKAIHPKRRTLQSASNRNGKHRRLSLNEFISRCKKT